ncbi:MAG TPA: polysaccharide biosynthesis/export family protein [Blastocatellia bacterium]
MMTKKILILSLSLAVACASALGQSAARLDDQKKSAGAQAETQAVSAEEEAAIQTQIASVYQNFFNSYRLGAGDVIAIYVDKHPDDSVQRVAVSPVGQVYYPLMGNVPVAGKTIIQIQEFFTAAIAEFIKDPKVTVSLLEAQSAKIGVLGDVRSPGVLLLTRPMRVLDAITASGGITEYGSSSNVTVLRQFEDGRVQTFSVNVKKILQGKANPEENAYVRAGDTIIVHGNTFKTITKISNMVGITGLITFITRGGR